MRIVLAGGGTGGHFYPLIAVAEQIKKIATEKKLLGVKLYFVSPKIIDKEMLMANDIQFVQIPAGKLRLYPSLQNIIDIIKTPYAILRTLWVMYRIYPDVVFSKGGFGAFPVVIAARLLFIPIVIHESDTVPGRANAWTGRFAQKIAVSYAEASKYFALEKVAHTGQPMQMSFLEHKEVPLPFTLDSQIPTIFITGGSQGSKMINETIVGSLDRLISDYQIVHQTGPNNFEETKMVADYLIKDNQNKSRYIPLPYIDADMMNTVMKQSDLIITRAGSTLFEIAMLEKPAIIVPIAKSNGDHQRKNAFAHARAGAGSVVEEKNFTTNILVSEINRIMKDTAVYDSMKNATKALQTPEASRIIADEVMKIADSH